LQAGEEGAKSFFLLFSSHHLMMNETRIMPLEQSLPASFMAFSLVCDENEVEAELCLLKNFALN
jgi:hypothetical protein